MQVLRIIMGILVFCYLVVFPISLAIKKAFCKVDGRGKWNVKVFFEGMLLTIFPWLVIAIVLILFYALRQIFENPIIVGAIIICIVVPILNYISNRY